MNKKKLLCLIVGHKLDSVRPKPTLKDIEQYLQTGVVMRCLRCQKEWK